MVVKIVAKASATSIESHIPFIPKNLGKISTQAIWKTSVLKKEMIAEIKPFPNAVNIEEPNIPNPAKINERQNTLNALIVI